jgi:hypothetical protein
MSKLTIFPQTGGLSQNIIKGACAFISIVKVSQGSAATTRTGIGSILASATTPSTAINIQQLTDFSLTKSLDNDFLVTAFGDTPVKIELKGINIIGIDNCYLDGSRSEAARSQILEFYDKNKVSSDHTARFDVAISNGPRQKASCFRCVIVGLNVSNSNQSGVNAVNKMYDYSMSLIGVKKA